ncbi:MAG TPA: hypothetical protein VH560_09225 [Polyangia bacterium]|nr:hypothetical protein [Polyangia bacterium]
MRRTLTSAFMRATLTVAKTAVLVGLLVASSSGTAHATEVGYNRTFGLGFELGDPTGITAKLWVAPTNSLDFGLGFYGYGFDDRCGGNCGYGGYGSGSFNMDYLWQSNIVRGQAQLDWHIGAGGRLIWGRGCDGDCIDIGARMPIGLDLMFANPSMLEVFFELAPILYVVHGPYFDVEGAIGVRYYF